jgi:propionate catabolism operon transcriptional regulator
MTLPTIAVIGHKILTPLIRKLQPEYSGKATILIYEDIFEGALTLSERLIAQQRADVVLTAGANGTFLREHASFPIATIKVTGYDLMRALVRARLHDHRIGLVAYRQIMAELEEVKEIFRFDVAQRSYETVAQATAAIRELAALGYKVIVGSSLTVEIASREGLIGVLVYSEDSARQGLNEAIELGRLARLGETRRERLSSIIYNLREGLLAVDFNGKIQAINPAMEKLIGVPREELFRRGADALSATFQSQLAAPGDDSEAETVVEVGSQTVVLSRSPLYENGRHAGTVFTSQESTLIQQSERRLRAFRQTSNFRAKHTFELFEKLSSGIRETIELGKRYAATDSTVLITGESGTGKEWFAQSIHNRSARHAGPFVPINCAAFPESLLESELFGYEDGAFTGSRKGGKPGLIELAHTGTLFLDEIGDMPKSLQTRLLRVLQEREVQRLGAGDATRVDIRVVAATLQPLEELMQKGAFREDLFYRLNVLRIEILPLRARPSDIPLLAKHFLSRVPASNARPMNPKPLLKLLLPLFQRYHWPGNIREMENIIERFAAILTTLDSTDDIDEHWIVKIAPELNNAAPRGEVDYAALVDKYGSVATAARMLGISRTTLWRRLRDGAS